MSILGVPGSDFISRIDSQLSAMSTNPVQNRAVTRALRMKADISDLQKHAADGVLHVSAQDRQRWDNVQVNKDGVTITENAQGSIQTVAVRETNSNNAQRFWVGTSEEYEQQNKAESDDLCIIVDDGAGGGGGGGGGGGPAAWGDITGTLADQTDLKNALDAKQNALIAGANITITGNTISASGGATRLPVIFTTAKAPWGVSGNTAKYDLSDFPSAVAGDYIINAGNIYQVTAVDSTISVLKIGNAIEGAVGAAYITAGNAGWGITDTGRNFDRINLNPNTPAVGSIIYSAAADMFFAVTSVSTATVAAKNISTVPGTYRTSAAQDVVDNALESRLDAVETAVGGAVYDVTMDGTSVVTGGVAAIDLTGKADLVGGKVPSGQLNVATETTYGVIKVTPYSNTNPSKTSGLYLNSGNLRLRVAADDLIDGRESNCAIVPTHLDYAVRSVSPLITSLPSDVVSPISLTDASATTRNHSFTYVHTPATAPTYQLPVVTDTTISHKIDLTVHFSSAVLSCSFQDAEGHAVTPVSTPEITSSSVVNYLCEYVTDVGWVVYPLVVPTAAAPSGPGYIVSGFTAPAEANGTYTPNGTSEDGETKYSNGNGYTLFHKWSRWHIIVDVFVDSSQTEDERAAVSASDSITSSYTIESGSPPMGTVTVVQA